MSTIPRPSPTMSLPVLRSLHHIRHFLPSYAFSRTPIAAYTLPWFSGNIYTRHAPHSPLEMVI